MEDSLNTNEIDELLGSIDMIGYSEEDFDIPIRLLGKIKQRLENTNKTLDSEQDLDSICRVLMLLEKRCLPNI